MEITVTSGVPAPKSKARAKHLPAWYPETRGRKGYYPWDDLRVGGSFFVPHRTTGDFAGAVAHARRTRPGWKLVSRTVTEGDVQGVRVWRVE